MVAHRSSSTIPTEISTTTITTRTIKKEKMTSSTTATNSSSGSSSSSSNNNNKKLPPASPLRPPKTGAPTTPNRARINSRDIPRSYSGLYGEENDLLPFELNRKQHTEWLESKLLLATYLAGILLFQIVITAVLDANSFDSIMIPPLPWSWTITNATHCLLSTIYLHWLKGSIFDNQGEMAALTLWEQLEGRRDTSVVKRVLTMVPTVLCYAACHFGGYEYRVCCTNGILWIVHVLGKLPYMNGRRLFGINQTIGIDDGNDVGLDMDDLDNGGGNDDIGGGSGGVKKNKNL